MNQELPSMDEMVANNEQLREINLSIENGDVVLTYTDGAKVILGGVSELDNNAYDNGLTLIVPDLDPYVYPISRRIQMAQPYLSVLAGPDWDEHELGMEDGIIVNGKVIAVKDFIADESGNLPEEYHASFTEFQSQVDLLAD